MFRRVHRLGLVLACLSCQGPGAGPDGDGTGDDDDDGKLTANADTVAPEVRSITPAAGATAVPVDVRVVVTFSEPIDPASGAADCGVPCAASWNAAGDELTLVPSQPFDWLDDVTVSLTGWTDLAGNPLAPFTSGFQTDLRDRVVPRPRDARRWKFEEVALEAGFLDEPFTYDAFASLRPTTSGGTCGDYDNDGFVDVYLGRGNVGTTRLYRNRGDGTFEEVTAAAGVAITDGIVTSPSFVDREGDGDLDLLANHFESGSTRFFGNNGDGTFTPVANAAGLDSGGLPVFSIIWGDVDRDLDLDVFFARFAVGDPSNPKFLYKNNGDGTFTEASLVSGLFSIDIQQSFTPNFADMDDDGYPELLVSSDHEQSVYLRNNGNGTFSVDREVELTDENGMGATVADYDNDGDLDWFVTAIYDPDGETEKIWGVEGNRLYQNQGDGFFFDVSEQAGVRDGGWGWAACAQDFDLDGHVDLFHVNGWHDLIDAADEEYGKDRSPLFRNDGDGTFTNVSAEVGILDTAQGRGVMCFDYDRDGDVDYLQTNFDQRPLLYRNDTPPDAHFLNVRLEALPPNTEGVGARVYVTANGVTQMRELRAGANYMSNDPVEAHFGLGPAEVVDELRIRWPDWTETVVTNVRADRFVVVTQKAQP